MRFFIALLLHACYKFSQKKYWFNKDAAVSTAYQTSVTGSVALHFFKAVAFPWPGYTNGAARLRTTINPDNGRSTQ